ncbi:MAG: hypothetical protein ACFE8V_14455 [Promethearchaeota archaeon]
MIFIKDDDTGFDKLDIVRKYFARIFNILKKDIRSKLLALNLTKDELKEIKKELAFLSEEKQREYLKELSKKK